MYTTFFDMHSGGDAKAEYEAIVIEGNEAEAVAIFMDRFGIDPYNTTCRCCGPDFSIDEKDTLEEATRYYRKHQMRYAVVYSKE